MAFATSDKHWISAQQTIHEPNTSPKEPRDRDKAECTSDIRRVRNFRHHAFDESAIPIESTSETATVAHCPPLVWYTLLISSRARDYLNIIPKNVRDTPKQYMDTDKLANPMRTTGLRPIWSDTWLQ